MIIKNDRQLNAKSRKCKVVSFNAATGVYRIWSPSGNTYTVNLDGSIIGCNCDWGRRGGAGCAHERCARRHWAALHEGRAVSFLSGQPDDVARKQHKAVKPVAASGDAALTMVLRDRFNPADALLAEINEMGKRHRALCRRMDGRYAAGPEFYRLRDEVETLRVALVEKQYEWASAVNPLRNNP